jgi:V/A-type H+/Na+-transporting ATPase subunit D
MDSVTPTRMELLARRAQIKLASEGVNLLTGKREALLKELIRRARELRELRQELHRRGRAAMAALAMARAVRGTPELRSAAVAGRREADVEIHRESVWGLPLADVSAGGIRRTPDERGMGQLDMSSHVLEAAEMAEDMAEQLIRCAPAEANIRLLGDEVRKVTRRLNALEEHLLPRLRHDVRAIGRVLEEREREDTFRLKRIKRRKAAARGSGSD